jgi:hypothetical protein
MKMPPEPEKGIAADAKLSLWRAELAGAVSHLFRTQMNVRAHRIVFAISIVALLSLPRSVFSDDASPAPLINIDPSTNIPNAFNESHGDGMVGWTFQLLAPFTVTHVGWYDENADGLSRAFQVGLWETGPQSLPFGGWGDSLIGDAVSGLIVPGATNAALSGVWRVVELPKPLTLQPGFYELGGLDRQTTADVIKYVPHFSGITPPGSSVSIGAAFYGGIPNIQTNFGPAKGYLTAPGLELGPMLFGTNTPLPEIPELRIRLISSGPSSPLASWILLTWTSGTLLEADVAAGPYAPIPFLPDQNYLSSSPLERQKFYRLNQ